MLRASQRLRREHHECHHHHPCGNYQSVAANFAIRPIRLAGLHPAQSNHWRRLKRLVDEDGLGGVTSNPAIFEKAITGSTDYADALVELQKRKDLDAMGVYEIIAIKDIQDAADILRPVYDSTTMRDGYVSLEVSPFLARDTEGTLKDARRLWKAVNRPNLLVKVPATLEGHSGHRAADQRRHQRQCHAALRAGDV